MACLVYIHWNADEGKAHIAQLKKAGHDVQFFSDDGGDAYRQICAAEPEALVISLDRLASHGRSWRRR